LFVTTYVSLARLAIIFVRSTQGSSSSRGLRKQRLIDVAKPDPQLSEHVENGLLVPACMPHLQDQGKSRKRRKQVKEIRAVAFIVPA
jgi:hypothetical protein